MPPHATARGGAPMARNARFLAGLVLILVAAACTASLPPRHAPGQARSTSAVSRAAKQNASALARAGLLVPATYQAACASEGSICPSNASGLIPAVLDRPLRFPRLRPGQACPTARGRPVNTAFFGGTALGTGPVRVVIAGAGALRHGAAILINPTSAPPWLGLKTLWFRVPAHHVPLVIRAERLAP